jgi:hypothetical protein
MSAASPDRGAVMKTLGPEHFERASVMLAYERAETVVAELIATIDFLEARALPLPRRYTGGGAAGGWAVSVAGGRVARWVLGIARGRARLGAAAFLVPAQPRSLLAHRPHHHPPDP